MRKVEEGMLQEVERSKQIRSGKSGERREEGRGKPNKDSMKKSLWKAAIGYVYLKIQIFFCKGTFCGWIIFIPEDMR